MEQPPLVSSPPRRTTATDRRLWWRWVGANAWSEAIGLGASAAVGGLLLTRTTTAADVVAGAALVVLVAGAAEGGVVGWAQHRVLRTRLPEVPARRWIGATVIGATIAWTLGMVPSTLLDLAEVGDASAPAPEPGLLLRLGLAMLLGLMAGPILGGAQAWVLRDHLARAWRWLPANAAAWAVGMPVIFLVAGALPASWHPAALLAVAGVTLALVGAVVGAIHGAVLVHMLREPRPGLHDQGR